MDKKNKNLNKVLLNNKGISENLKIEKVQKLNISDNYEPYKFNFEVSNGDKIYYKVITNVQTPNNAIYDIKITDVLDSHLSYVEGSLKNDIGTANWNSQGSSVVNGKIVGGIIEWTIPILYYISSSDNYKTLTFESIVVSP